MRLPLRCRSASRNGCRLRFFDLFRMAILQSALQASGDQANVIGSGFVFGFDSGSRRSALDTCIGTTALALVAGPWRLSFWYTRDSVRNNGLPGTLLPGQGRSPPNQRHFTAQSPAWESSRPAIPSPLEKSGRRWFQELDDRSRGGQKPLRKPFCDQETGPGLEIGSVESNNNLIGRKPTACNRRNIDQKPQTLEAYHVAGTSRPQQTCS